MRELEKTFPTKEEMEAELQAMTQLGGAMLEASESPASREAVKVLLKMAGKTLAELEAEVVYAGPAEAGFQVGVEFKGGWKEKIEEARKNAPAEGEEGFRYGKDKESIAHAVAKMSMAQKVQLALKGGREERRVLMKDSHYQVHSYVLKNPRLSTEEVAQISRMMSLTQEMIATIANNTEWMAHSGVRTAIVKNPKTPANIVQKHISSLNDNDLLQIAKSEHVKDVVTRMAKKVLASRGKPIK